MDTSDTRGPSATVTPIRQTMSGDLRVLEVVASALPVTLLTPDAPDVYTVTGVFSRRVDPAEAAILHSDATTGALRAAGYPGVTLQVADRRLLIEDTNLEMLQAGLASAIGRILQDAAAAVADRRRQAEADLAQALVAETERAERVRALAASISFASPL